MLSLFSLLSKCHCVSFIFVSNINKTLSQILNKKDIALNNSSIFQELNKKLKNFISFVGDDIGNNPFKTVNVLSNILQVICFGKFYLMRWAWPH